MQNTRAARVGPRVTMGEIKTKDILCIAFDELLRCQYFASHNIITARLFSFKLCLLLLILRSISVNSVCNTKSPFSRMKANDGQTIFINLLLFSSVSRDEKKIFQRLPSRTAIHRSMVPFIRERERDRKKRNFFRNKFRCRTRVSRKPNQHVQ